MAHDASPAAQAELASLLQAERAALHTFITLLETEQQALTAGQIDQLMSLAERKTVTVQELNRLADGRRNMLLARGAPSTDGGGVETWLQAHAAGSVAVWRDIQGLAARAQETNRHNGQLIQIRLRHNQQALSVLRNAANSASGLYGPDGQPQLRATGRTLGSG